MLKNNLYTKAYLNIIKESFDIEKCQKTASEIGGEYIAETNTIDCKGKKISFKDWWLNDKGSFDFKLINVFSDWSMMFYRCKHLKYLPEDFIIPDYVTTCHYMFDSCDSLEYLPDNFTIPNNVTNCTGMFFGCKKLLNLPANFKIGTSVKSCANMFNGCEYLTFLPKDFIIPNSVEECNGMFYNCVSLQDPLDIHIPADCNTYCMFDGCDQLNHTDPDYYKTWEL